MLRVEVELKLVWAVAQRELREALRNKWLWFYAAGFAVLAFALAQAGVVSAGYSGLGGFGRTAASLINAILLFAPLIGLSIGATTLAGERERGTLLYLLAQPVSRAEVFWGKALGASLAVIGALSLGFGVAGLALASAGGGKPGAYLALAGHTFLLALASLGLGFLISTLTRKASTAMAGALLVWLLLVFVGDLGLMGATAALRPSPDALLAALLVNPLQSSSWARFTACAPRSTRWAPPASTPHTGSARHCRSCCTACWSRWIAASLGLAFALFNRRGDV